MKKEKKTINFLILILSFIAVVLTSVIGSLFTSDSISSGWYESIRPSIAPPNFVFPIVWTILYIMIALSIYFSLTSSATKNQKKILAILFVLNLYFNVLWSILYFGQQDIFGALIDLFFLWINTLALLIFSFKITKKTFYLLIPYFLWLTFAGVLNWLSLIKLQS